VDKQKHIEPTLDAGPQQVLAQSTGSGALAGGAAPAVAGTRYEVLGEIARGGMGAILRVRDTALQRELAIKVIKEGLPATSEAMQRFIDEARISGQLQHPGVVPVHQLGKLPDGRLFFAMKLVQGETLQDLLHRRSSPAQDLPRFLKVFEQVCQTLAFAHSRQIIHRDLKPLNIMVGAFGEVQVMDWGLAKVVGTGDSTIRVRSQVSASATAGETLTATSLPEGASGSNFQTQAGMILGTPSYMAPEQARGEIDRIDERADVFGLGAILCVILTGRPPYAGQNVSEILGRACAGDVADGLTRLDDCGADRELTALARACLEPDLAARLRNGKAVADAMTVYLEGVAERLKQAEIARATEQAKAETARLRAEAERKRRRTQLTFVGAAAILLIVGISSFLVLRQQAAKRRSETSTAVERALSKAEELESQARKMSTADSAGAESAFTVWKASAAAVEEAEAALKAGDPDADTRAAVETRKEEIEKRKTTAEEILIRRRKEDRLLIALEDVYLRPYAELGSGKTGNQPNFRDVLKAFQEFGIDVMSGEESTAGAALSDASLALRERAVAALDGAAYDLKEQRLYAIAEHIPKEPWVAKYRESWTKGKPVIKRFLDTSDLSKLGPVYASQACDAYNALGDPEAALRARRLIHLHHPHDFWNNLQLSFALSSSRNSTPAQRQEAVGYCRAAIAARPNLYSVHLALAYQLEQAGNLEEAARINDRVLELFPDDSPAIVAVAYKYAWTHNNFKRAEALASQVIKRHPEFYRAYCCFAVVRATLGDMKAAIPAAHKAVELAPDAPDAHRELLLVLIKAGDKEAVRAAARVAPLEKYDQHFGLPDVVRAFQEAGDLKNAIRAARRYAELKPDDPTMFVTLTHLYR
jgi:serine/threonine-protein kinase